MSHKETNRQLVALAAEITGTRYCRACNAQRQLAGGFKPSGRSPWRCARCVGERKAGPKHLSGSHREGGE